MKNDNDIERFQRERNIIRVVLRKNIRAYLDYAGN